MIFLSNIEHCAEANQRKKKTESQMGRHSNRAANHEKWLIAQLATWCPSSTGTRRQTNTPTATLIQTQTHTHAQPHICMCICRTFATNTLNEATVGRTPSPVLRNPIKFQKDIKSFSPFNKVHLLVVYLNTCILDNTVISWFQSRISKIYHSFHNDKFPFCYLPLPWMPGENELERQQSGTLLLLCASTCHW